MIREEARKGSCHMYLNISSSEQNSLWSGGFSLVRLQLLSSFHLHGAVNDPVWSHRLQTLNLHDHNLKTPTEGSNRMMCSVWTAKEKPPKTINFQCLSDQSHLQSERQHHVRLGQDVSLVSHVQEGVVHGGAFELLFEVRTSFGHRQTLQVRHEQVDRRTQLLHKKRLHLCRDELRVSPLLQDGHTDTQLKQQHVLMFELHSVRMMYVQSFHIHCIKRSCSWSSLRI